MMPEKETHPARMSTVTVSPMQRGASKLWVRLLMAPMHTTMVRNRVMTTSATVARPIWLSPCTTLNAAPEELSKFSTEEIV